MVPIPPLEQDYQERPHGRSAMLASAAMPRVGFGLSERAPGEERSESGGALSIALTSASVRIEDGLLMAFGPEGDPIPPHTFVAAAAEQPDAEVKLADGRTAPAARVARVLEAQAKGRLGAAHGDPSGAAAWIEAMLGLGPQPAPAAGAELGGEQRACELTVFGRELMLTTPGGRSFLLTDAAPGQPGAATVGLMLADDRPLSVGELVERLRSHSQPRPRVDAAARSGEPGSQGWTISQGRTGSQGETGSQDWRGGQGGTGSQPAPRVQPLAEVVLPGCAVERSDDGLVLDLPAVGAVRLARLADGAPAGPRVAIALADGRPASLADVIAAFEPDEPAARSERPALPAPDRHPALPGPAIPARQLPVTLRTPRGEGVDPVRIAVLIVDGVPPGGVLSAGIDDGDGRWLISPRHLLGLTLTPPAGWTGDPTFEVTAVAVRNRTGEFATASERVVLTPGSAAEAPLPLALDPALLQAAGPAMDAMMIRGVPPGARLSAGTYDAATDGWVLRPDQLEGLAITAPAGQVDVTLTVLGISLAAGGRAEARVLTRLTIPRR